MIRYAYLRDLGLVYVPSGVPSYTRLCSAFTTESSIPSSGSDFMKSGTVSNAAITSSIEGAGLGRGPNVSELSIAIHAITLREK